MRLDFTLTNEMTESAREYYSFIKDVNAALSDISVERFIYGLNQQRIDLHDKLCSLWGFEKMDTKFMTDNLDKYPSFEDFFQALCQLKNSKVKRKGI